MGLFNNKKQDVLSLPNKPRHIGIIMDGNGRWAKKRGLPRMAGHREGAENFKRIGEYLIDIDIPVSTFYAFSTENWKRPEEEVKNIMSLLLEYLEEWMDMRKDKNMHFHFIGDRTAFSPRIQEMMAIIEEKSSIYPHQLNLALNYGSRDELCMAYQTLMKKGITEVTPEDISSALYTAGQPEVDLIIRTGGEQRLSNFLLYQSAYAEFYFTDKLWPDIKKSDIDDAIRYFSNCERRFGGVIKGKE